MSDAINNELAPRKPLRVWPGLLAVAFQWLAWFFLPMFMPEAGPYGIFAGLLAGLAVVLWWLFFSRAPWLERLGILTLIVISVMAAKLLVHESIAGGGMGFILYIYAVPVLSLALAIGAAVGRRLSTGARRAAIAVAVLLACAAFMLVRTGGITGEGDSDIHWRWTPTPEDRLLAEAGEARRTQTDTALAPNAQPASSVAVWPGFRGPNRDGIVRGVSIEVNWTASPPVELWRRPIGPGWSSFAVQGARLYTQEQRGEEEVVSCYSVTTGELIWNHTDPVRFWESNAGAGPRATPTLHEGRLYSLGATGLLNALDAQTGTVLWSRNAASDTGGTLPHWGFSASPLVVEDVVLVDAGGLAAYRRTTGEPRWVGKKAGGSYSSPHFAIIAGVEQVLMLRGGALVSIAPADGSTLWERSWQKGVASIVQPAVLPAAEGRETAITADILLAAADEMGGIGMRRIAVTRDPEAWSIEERWTTRGLKPYFNDFVVHRGHAYGFDNSILACINLENGERKWKGGRYGHGQLILLADQDVLLVLSEEGELALISAKPDAFQELARFAAIEGKTWNHPVLAGDVLLVRNDQEMAAFRLALATY